MKRVTQHFKIKDINVFKNLLLEWGSLSDTFVWLDSNDHQNQFSVFSAVLAVGKISEISSSPTNAFKKLKDYRNNLNDWVFGYLGYDLKNSVETTYSQNPDQLQFPDMYFFQPKKVIKIKGHLVSFIYLKTEESQIKKDIETIKTIKPSKKRSQSISLRSATSKNIYFDTFSKIMTHIRKGNIYQVNYCTEHFYEGILESPLSIFQKLNQTSQMPFSAFMMFNKKGVISTSPERFLKKHHRQIISQPIKGTYKTSSQTKENEQFVTFLQNNRKERSENIMTTDLVRNDLSRIAEPGTVRVNNLCRVESLKGINQMFSDVMAYSEVGIDAVDIVKAMFPIASMTGVPKLSATKIIEEYEIFKRGLYSGSLGYFTPENNFDFNVVIRSLLFNNTNGYASCSVGSAITALSDPRSEYEECLLKIQRLKNTLEHL